MEQEFRDNLLRKAEEVGRLCGLSEESIGQKAINDNTFFRRVREKGAGFTVRTYARLMSFMDERLEEARESA